MRAPLRLRTVLTLVDEGTTRPIDAPREASRSPRFPCMAPILATSRRS